MSLASVYLSAVQERYKNIKDLGDKTLGQMSDENIHWHLNEESNNIAIIVKHMSGNSISRWTDFLASDGEKPNRNRDREFVDDVSSKQELLEIWEKGWNTLFGTLNSLKEEDLVKTIYIRGKACLVVEAIEKQLEHNAYHVGQIVYVGKQIKNEDWQNLSIPKRKPE